MFENRFVYEVVVQDDISLRETLNAAQRDQSRIARTSSDEKNLRSILQDSLRVSVSLTLVPGLNWTLMWDHPQGVRKTSVVETPVRAWP